MISADKVQKGQLVTIDFKNGGFGLAYELDGNLYTKPRTGDIAYPLPIQEDHYKVKRDGGESFKQAFNYEMDQESN